MSPAMVNHTLYDACVCAHGIAIYIYVKSQFKSEHDEIVWVQYDDNKEQPKKNLQ